MGCLFCNIINGTTPSKKVYENDTVYAFEDINPQAPVHVLVIHKKHVERIDDLDAGNSVHHGGPLPGGQGNRPDQGDRLKRATG